MKLSALKTVTLFLGESHPDISSKEKEEKTGKVLVTVCTKQQMCFFLRFHSRSLYKKKTWLILETSQIHITSRWINFSIDPGI